MGWRKKLCTKREVNGDLTFHYIVRERLEKKENKLNKLSFHFQAAVKTLSLDSFTG